MNDGEKYENYSFFQEFFSDKDHDEYARFLQLCNQVGSRMLNAIHLCIVKKEVNLISGNS